MNRFVATTTLLLLASAGFSQITSERPVSTPVFGPARVLGSGITSDGDGFLAIWRNGAGDGLFSTRISRDGTVLDPFGVFLPGVNGVSLIWAGDRYLDIWNETNKIVAAELGTDGHVIAQPRIIQNNVIFGAVASNGKVTVLLTFDTYGPGYSGPNTNGYTVLDGGLNVIASESYPASLAFPIGPPAPRAAPFTQLTRVASDGKDFLVAWSDGDFFSTEPPAVHVRRIPGTGLPTAEIVLFGGTLHDLVWDGKNYNLAFKSQGTSGSLAVARLRVSGQPFDTLAISSATKGGSISLVPIGNESILAAYTRVALPLYSGSERAFVATPYPARGRAVRK